MVVSRAVPPPDGAFSYSILYTIVPVPIETIRTFFTAKVSFYNTITRCAIELAVLIVCCDMQIELSMCLIRVQAIEKYRDLTSLEHAEINFLSVPVPFCEVLANATSIDMPF